MRSALGKMSFIIVDGGKKGLLENCRLRSLFEHYQRFSYQARSHVKYIVMDWMPLYERLAKTVFPNAQVVYERFHINNTMCKFIFINVYVSAIDRRKSRHGELSTTGVSFFNIKPILILMNIMRAATYNYIQALKYSYNQKRPRSAIKSPF